MFNSQPPELMAVSGVVVVVLVDYLRQHQAWGWMRLVQGAANFKGVAGLRFVKVMGSGHGGGFSIRPSASHQGLIAVFDDAEHASAFMAGPYIQTLWERSAQCWSGMLAVTSARGHWDGQAWEVTDPQSLGRYAHLTGDTSTQPLAAITRASIRPAKAMAFWKFAPAAQADLSKAPGCSLAMGLGEAPLVRQCTFSLWKDTPSMEAYAHSGAHKHAIEAAYRNNFFSESLFVRMRLLMQQGQWQAHPLLPLPAAHG
jgi:hypothetical protein